MLELVFRAFKGRRFIDMKGTAAACAGSCITKVSPGILRGRVKPGRRMDIFGEKGAGLA